MAGIFVGGASSRMGGRPKGLLTAPEGITIVDRWRAMLAELGVEHVLVGKRAEYAAIPLVTLEDDPPGVGPIGGLAALLAHAGQRRALVVGCDMPFVTREDVAALITSEEDALAVAARRDERWEPLLSRYDAPRALPVVRRRIAEGRLSLQALLTELGALPVAIEPAHLADWDSPQDLKSES